MGKLLHVGCGGEPMPVWAEGKYEETRLDICPDHSPHIVASMADMGDIGPFDCVYSSHSLEHLVPHEAQQALREFHRVLNDGGAAVILVPDLEGVHATDEVLFDAPCGPVAGNDLIYGLRALLPAMPYMAHRCGFVSETLERGLRDAGFGVVSVKRLENHNLMAVAVK